MTEAGYTTQDLLLRVSPDYDPALLRLDRYEPLLDALCGDREFQKDAIRTVCRLLAGGQYPDTRGLAKQNYASNAHLADRYGSFDGLVEELPFPDALSCSVDLATATGKSWVMYGIARILLAENIVDRVLLLCPSLTIEAGLAAKFKKLSADSRLRDLVPADAAYRTPDITNADVTTGPGDICIENIHATYEHVSSSVRDSFAGKGASTLVLNDEVHHVYSPPTKSGAVRKWRDFLLNEDFAFERIAGFSGTCYRGDSYFPDVVYRYSLRDAMEDGRVKEVRYVAKDESANQSERFQKYLKLHEQNQLRHPELKPLSIIVTSTREGAAQLAQDFVRFLIEDVKISPRAAEDQVLVVTSLDAHKANVARLPYVDRTQSPVQWIFSVSMLTEGWDVHNVYQIVPHEKRAFNSKLLIAQVLGRGLRVPIGVTRPAVWVFNHSSWSSEIAGLVDEVLEGRRLNSYPVSSGERAKHHFDLHTVTYLTRTTEQELKPRNGNGRVQLFKRGHLRFETQPTELVRQTVFVGAVGGGEYTQQTTVQYKAYTVDEVVRQLQARLKSIDAEKQTDYARQYPPKMLRSVIRASLKEINESRDLVWETNLQHCFRALGNTQRPVAKAVRIKRDPDQLKVIPTGGMRQRSVALTSFAREATVFFDSESAAASRDADARVVAELMSQDSAFPQKAVRFVENRYYFKSPVNVVLTTHEPERRFVRRLFEPEIAERLKAWIKAPDTGLYEIRYSYRIGDHTKEKRFNPDLFLLLADTKTMLVVELKADNDDSLENRAKLRAAREHFAAVNAAQAAASYHVTFISPASYDAFFQALREGKAAGFVSELDARLLAV